MVHNGPLVGQWPAQVPGCSHTDLLAAEVIPDPCTVIMKAGNSLGVERRLDLEPQL